jgi:hypothetical protein
MIDVRTTAPPEPPAAEPRRRVPETPVWRAVAIVICALCVGALLNAEPLGRTAAAQRPGALRNVAVAAADFAGDVASLTRFDVPRRLIDEARDRSGSPAAPTSIEPTVVFVPTPEHPARMWVGGDSLVDTFGPALVGGAEETRVVTARWDVRYSSGLTRPLLFDWADYVSRELAAHPVEIVVFMVGANDAQPIEVEGAGWASFPGDDWKQEYRTRVGRLMDLLAAHAATVYWIGQPIARSDRQSERIAVMNEIYRRESATRTAVRYVDAWELFSDAEGDYSDYLPDASGAPVRVRNADGIHLSPAGAALLTEATLEVIERDWTLP